MEYERCNIEKNASRNSGSEALDQGVGVFIDSRDRQTNEDVADDDHESCPGHVSLKKGRFGRADMSGSHVNNSIDD